MNQMSNFVYSVKPNIDAREPDRSKGADCSTFAILFAALLP